jgi:hypothetical protein
MIAEDGAHIEEQRVHFAPGERDFGGQSAWRLLEEFFRIRGAVWNLEFLNKEWSTRHAPLPRSRAADALPARDDRPRPEFNHVGDGCSRRASSYGTAPLVTQPDHLASTDRASACDRTVELVRVLDWPEQTLPTQT